MDRVGWQSPTVSLEGPSRNGGSFSTKQFSCADVEKAGSAQLGRRMRPSVHSGSAVQTWRKQEVHSWDEGCGHLYIVAQLCRHGESRKCTAETKDTAICT